MSLVKLYVEGDFNDADYSTTSVDIDLDRKLLTDDEVNVYVRKLVEKNIPVYSVNETSSLEDILISMMEDK